MSLKTEPRKIARNGIHARKNNKLVCNGIATTGKRCRNGVECECIEGQCDCGKSIDYCGTHSYLQDYTPDEQNAIRDVTTPFLQCVRCCKWKKEVTETNKKCNQCIEIVKDILLKRKNKPRDECCNIQKNKSDGEPTKCKFEVVKDMDVFKEYFEKFGINDDEYLKLLSENCIFCKIHLETYLRYMYKTRRIITRDE
jgi:hypothetical protein